MNSFNYSIKKILINLLIVIALGILFGFLFLKVYLPLYTNHGETVSVPDLSGYEYQEATNLLENTGLQYEVSLDSGFSTELPALAILKQIPEANAQVKSGRKIYLTLNARNAPMIKMPNLVNMPLKNVQEILANIGLERGDIVYVPDIGINVVLEQRYRGVTVREGFEIPKGARIDLTVGDGNGNQLLFVPDLTGLDFEEGEFLILGSGLRVGNKNFSSTDSVAPDRIFLQAPPAGTQVRTGEPIDVWISKNQ
ncbi:PASTA domain-containing protein [Algoriphagus sp. H41]|uniref:PASTA domain-containing protein n=1 Tax=Algoriphagus oliviformis TaxID=2811231 RepID=A0ABS3C442_9BACT|nr:PASTA domain-containing protein [Algoriphagus oliviformis]MBN7811882.1 PASTA domain-containing protein [Algoriphagus oliviformis]